MMTFDDFKKSEKTAQAVEIATTELKKYGIEVDGFSCLKNQKPIRTKDGFRLGKEFFLVIFDLRRGESLFMLKIISTKRGMPSKGVILRHVTDLVNVMNNQFNLGLARKDE